IAVADSRFQDDLVRQAKAHGKLPRGYEVPERYRHNLPQVLDDKLSPWAQAGLLPDFPFGTDLTDDELHIVRALKKLKHASAHPMELVEMTLKSVWEGKEAPRSYLERLGLTEAHSFRDLFVRRLFAGNL
ncbi:MAG: acetyl-CoA hydrolase, partial [Aquincola sp.]|nr:acetyl-CoA hydrolase [Aquincola sp.]